MGNEPVGRSISASLSSRGGRYIVIALVLLWTIPTFGLLVSSVRPEQEVKTSGWWEAFIRPKFTLSNYDAVLSSSPGSANLGHFFFNSMKITVPAVILSVGIGARDGWGDYAGGPAPGLSFTTAGWLHGTEIAAIATDTWGFEVRPNEFENAFQPLHQVAIPNIGLLIGEMWDLEALAEDCAADGVYEFLLAAAPLRITGAVGSPVNPIAIK